MGIFSSIKNAIFGKGDDDKKPTAPAAAPKPAAPAAPAAPAKPAAISGVDVEANV